MSRGSRSREEAEIGAQAAAEAFLANEVELYADVLLPVELYGLLRAVLERVAPGVEEDARKTEGILLVRALADVLEEGSSPACTSAFDYWNSRLSGTITLPVRDGMPL